MQTRRARPEQLWAPLRRRPSTLDGRRSSQSLVSCLSCIAGADAGHIGTDEHCPARWAPRARIEWFSAVPRRCSSGAKAMASDRSSGGRAASERADSVRPAPDTSRAPCSRRQPRAPWAPHSSPRVRSTCSLGARLTRGGCAFSSAQPRLSADGSRLHCRAWRAHSNREPCSRREVATTRTLRRARITPARPAQRLMRVRLGTRDDQRPRGNVWRACAGLRA